MPDDIFDIVVAGVEVAKTYVPPKDNVDEKPMTAVLTPEQTEAEKRKYENINNDIGEALAPGERFLTPAEAKARRKAIADQRRAQGLEVFE